MKLFFQQNYLHSIFTSHIYQEMLKNNYAESFESLLLPSKKGNNFD